MRFDWDDRKARTNQRKHQVSFGEAETVFLDELARVDRDPDHSVLEARYLIFGRSAAGRLLLVSFAEYGETIRIISARQVNREEQKRYEEEIL